MLNTTYNTTSILSTKVLNTPERETYGKLDINLILSKYEEYMGHTPTDKQPRFIANTMCRALHKMIDDLKDTSFKDTFPSVVERTFKWYKTKYEGEMAGESLNTMYRKIKHLLIPATIKKYVKPQ